MFLCDLDVTSSSSELCELARSKLLPPPSACEPSESDSDSLRWPLGSVDSVSRMLRYDVRETIAYFCINPIPRI